MSLKEKPAVLVVDDDPAILHSYMFLLSVAGYTPVTAVSGDEARSRMMEHTPPVALVDLKIKNENGIEVASVLREMDPFLEVIIITGYPSHETAVRAMKIGAFDYLAKTSETETILETLREALAQRELKLFQSGVSGYREGSIRLIVVCHNTLTRHGILQFLSRSEHFQLVNFFPSLPVLLHTPEINREGLLLVCAQCSFRDEEEAIGSVSKLRRDLPSLRVVLFNVDYPEETRTELIKRGAAGFLETNLPDGEMEKALLDIHRGEIRVEPNVLSRAIAELADFYARSNLSASPPPDETEGVLTAREKEILRCLARGMKNKAIGEKLFISEKTVKTHVNNIFRKLGAETRLQAINLAYERKLLF